MRAASLQDARAMIIARAQDDLLQDARPNRARGAAFVGGLPDPCNPATRLPSNPAVLNQCTWMQGDDATMPHETEGSFDSS